MLLPRCHIFIMTTNVDMLYGRCYCQVADGMATLIIMLADVIAKWQREWPLQGWSVGRCYCHVADGIATGSYYFSSTFGQKQNYRIIFSDTPSWCIKL